MSLFGGHASVRPPRFIHDWIDAAEAEARHIGLGGRGYRRLGNRLSGNRLRGARAKHEGTVAISKVLHSLGAEIGENFQHAGASLKHGAHEAKEKLKGLFHRKK